MAMTGASAARSEVLIYHFVVSLDGQTLPRELMDRMLECVVESSINLPDVCTRSEERRVGKECRL